MWYKIRELYSKGFNKTQIAFQLGLHRSTVRRYLKMDEDTLTAKLQHRRQYPRILDKYESYVCDILSRYRFLSASQIHDWMKEQYPDLPVVCGKTVYNFVEAVRRKYNLDKEGLSKRVYEKMPDTPYGEYAQMDFGESRMSTDRGGFVKVYFFVMVMSRSRQKFVYFPVRLSPRPWPYMPMNWLSRISKESRERSSMTRTKSCWSGKTWVTSY